MSDDETTQAEPSEESLAEMPEVDFARAIRPNKLGWSPALLDENRVIAGAFARA